MALTLGACVDSYKQQCKRYLMCRSRYGFPGKSKIFFQLSIQRSLILCWFLVYLFSSLEGGEGRGGREGGGREGRGGGGEGRGGEGRGGDGRGGGGGGEGSNRREGKGREGN